MVIEAIRRKRALDGADAFVLLTAHREFMEQIPGKNMRVLLFSGLKTTESAEYTEKNGNPLRSLCTLWLILDKQ